MHGKRLTRWALAVTAALLAMGLSSAFQAQSPGGSEGRVVTLTVWTFATAQAGWDVTAKDEAGDLHKDFETDQATTYSEGVVRFRVKQITEDKSGRSVLLDKLDSVTTSLGVSGGGKRETANHVYCCPVGDQFREDHSSWVYELDPAREAWRGPDLDSRDGPPDEFDVDPAGQPSYHGYRVQGVAVGETNYPGMPPRQLRKDNFGNRAMGALQYAYGKAIHDKDFQSRLHVRADWSKRVSVTGHASFSYTEGIPIVFISGNHQLGGKGTSQATVHVDWTLSEEPSPVEMDLIPQAGYEFWLPRGGKDEKTPGSTFTVKIDIHKAGRPGVAPDVQISRLTVWLADTSKEKGVCMNYPRQGKTSKPDYDFRIKPATGWTLKEDDQKAEADKPPPQRHVALNCYDYGGWTALMATAELADGRHVVGRVKGGSQSAQLTIPKDDNHNHIADAWETATGGGTDATADADGLPRGNDVDGDGLSFYEEYRGFRCKGAHTRTYPWRKDLFVFDPGNLGIGFFGASGITAHLVDRDEFDEDGDGGSSNPNVINFNRGYAALGLQHLLYLRNKKSSRPGVLGWVRGGTPKNVPFINVDVVECYKMGKDWLPYVIAHELGHGCNLDEHGFTDYVGEDLQTLTDGQWSYLYGRDGEKLNARVAAPHGQTSGRQECIMRYNRGEYYEKADGPCRWRKPGEDTLVRGAPYPDDRIPLGTLFCDSRDGSGVNDPAFPGGSVAGGTIKGVGECQRHFQVNDLRSAEGP